MGTMIFSAVCDRTGQGDWYVAFRSEDKVAAQSWVDGHKAEGRGAYLYDERDMRIGLPDQGTYRAVTVKDGKYRFGEITLHRA